MNFPKSIPLKEFGIEIERSKRMHAETSYAMQSYMYIHK